MYFWSLIFLVIAAAAGAAGLYFIDDAYSTIVKVIALVFVLLSLITFAGFYYTKSTVQNNKSPDDNESGLPQKNTN